MEIFGNVSFFYGLIIFILGLIIGSFLNVVIYRFNTGRNLGGRSACLSCRHSLSWHELVPVLSFFFQKGKCSHCGTRISWQYPLIELFSGLAFLIIFLKYQYLVLVSVPVFAVVLLYYFLIFSYLTVILVYDFRHKIIPDKLVYLLVFFSLFEIIISPLASTGSFALPDLKSFASFILSGIVLSAPLALIWLLSKGKWIGLGDAKLAIAVGFLLGLSGGISAFLLAFWIGAAVSLIILLFQTNDMNIKSEIPFAPFIILGFALVFFFDIDLASLINLFSLPLS